MSNILITGASGLIGTRLTELLLQKGHEVSHLSRSKKQGKIQSFEWDVESGAFDRDALVHVESIIHLSGAGIADKRWTSSRKKEILESRTQSTRLLFNELKKPGHSVKTFVSASAIGYYGFEDNETILTEGHSAGKDFLAQVVKQWEEEVDRVSVLGIRVVKMRVGIVLTMSGGILKELIKPIKYFVGAPLGSGKQNLSWIHIDDVCYMFIKAVEDPAMQGAYNASGPYPVTNKELTKAIADVMGKPLIMPPVPGFALKLFLGEMADLVLYGSKVSSAKIQNAGFQFQFKDMESALKDLIS